jgi:hypothetical protein
VLRDPALAATVLSALEDLDASGSVSITDLDSFPLVGEEWTIKPDDGALLADTQSFNDTTHRPATPDAATAVRRRTTSEGSGELKALEALEKDDMIGWMKQSAARHNITQVYCRRRHTYDMAARLDSARAPAIKSMHHARCSAIALAAAMHMLTSIVLFIRRALCRSPPGVFDPAQALPARASNPPGSEALSSSPPRPFTPGGGKRAARARRMPQIGSTGQPEV